jgi:hypothetical protein
MARRILRGEHCVFQARRHHDRDLSRNVFGVNQCLVVVDCFSESQKLRRIGTSLPQHVCVCPQQRSGRRIASDSRSRGRREKLFPAFVRFPFS